MLWLDIYTSKYKINWNGLWVIWEAVIHTSSLAQTHTVSEKPVLFLLEVCQVLERSCFLITQLCGWHRMDCFSDLVHPPTVRMFSCSLIMRAWSSSHGISSTHAKAVTLGQRCSFSSILEFNWCSNCLVVLCSCHTHYTFFSFLV